MKRFFYCSVLLLAFLLSACAGLFEHHLTESECQQVNTKALGFQDGAQGQDKNYFLQHVKDCEKYQIQLNKKKYLRGWRRGNRRYCRVDNIYQVGKQGSDYPSVCPMSPARQRAFDRGHTIAKLIAQTKNKIYDIDNEIKNIANMRQQREDLRDRIDSVKGDIRLRQNHFDTTRYEKDLARLQRQEFSLSERLSSLHGAIDRLQAERSRLQNHISHLRQA